MIFMNFLEAMTALAEGKKVGRLDYGPNIFYFADFKNKRERERVATLLLRAVKRTGA